MTIIGALLALPFVVVLIDGTAFQVRMALRHRRERRNLGTRG